MKAKIELEDGTIVKVNLELKDGVYVLIPANNYSQFKDGDVVVCGWEGTEWICILKYINNIEIDEYCRLILKSNKVCYKNSLSTTYSIAIDYARFATEDEKKQLFDALAKVGKMWDAEKKAVVDLKWKPQMGEKYCYPTFYTIDGFIPSLDNWNNISLDNARYKKGWIFPYSDKGKAQCQELCDKLNNVIKKVKL